MTEWHDLSCRRLDVFTSGGISSCLSCGSIRPDSETSPSKYTCTDNGIIYQPLISTTDIRLLTLLQGDFDDPIKCHLSLSSTASMINYDAISYTWATEDGEMKWTECITLNGQEFLVTPNCMMALRHVRSRGAKKVIWIDAVCLNQKDVEERGHQVRLMPQIFSRAQHVLIYVGEPVPEEEKLLRVLQADPVPTMPLQPLQLVLETFLERRYFSRAWVLQEVALARKATLICGEFSMPWSMVQIPQLAARGLLIDAKDKPRLLNMLQLPSVLQFRAPAYRDSSDLLRLLDLARRSHATDPRDKLFAVFGLVSCADADGIVANYTKSTEETYMQMAGWIAQRFGVPAMLVRAFHHDQSSHMGRPATRASLPSWTPDWAESPALRSWAELEEMHRECRVGLAPAGLPVYVDLASKSLRFHVLRLGGLCGIVDEHRSQSGNGNRRVAPWAYTAFNVNLDGNGNKSCTPDEFDFKNPLGNHYRYVDLQIYLIPEPDEYKDFSFDEAGSVSVYIDASSCTWIHEGREGRKRIGHFNKYALCGQDLGCGDVRAKGLLHMNGLAHQGVWKSGHFEAIDLVDEDTAPYPALDADVIRLIHFERLAFAQREVMWMPQIQG